MSKNKNVFQLFVILSARNGKYLKITRQEPAQNQAIVNHVSCAKSLENHPV
jgi:hypothetical protein